VGWRSQFEPSVSDRKAFNEERGNCWNERLMCLAGPRSLRRQGLIRGSDNPGNINFQDNLLNAILSR